MRVSKLFFLFVSAVIACGVVVLFHTSVSAAKSMDSLIVEVSFDRTLANVNHGAKQLQPPLAYGDVILIRGYVYREGTWDCPDMDCGVLPTGGAQFPDDMIGVITCTGNFTSDPFAAFIMNPIPFGNEVGLFFLNLSFGNDGSSADGFNEDSSNMLELRGKTLLGFDGSHPAEFTVMGGTGVFAEARGEVLETMIRPNPSGAFNFILDLTGLTNIPRGLVKDLISGMM